MVQDTGFSAIIPCGEGLLAFTTLDEAALRFAAVEARYAFHQRRAREVAGDCFAAGHVLGALLKEVGLG